jgi:hypothetical protein
MENVTDDNVLLSDQTDSEPISVRIVDEVATQLDCDHTDIEPLASAIDPEALDDMVHSSTDVTISFHYAGCRVEVTGHDSGASVDVTSSVLCD